MVTFSLENEPFYTVEAWIKKNAKLAFFMSLAKKLKFFHLLCLSKIDREKVFADVLDRKEAFKDCKKICL